LTATPDGYDGHFTTYAAAYAGITKDDTLKIVGEYTISESIQKSLIFSGNSTNDKLVSPAGDNFVFQGGYPQETTKFSNITLETSGTLTDDLFEFSNTIDFYLTNVVININNTVSSF